RGARPGERGAGARTARLRRCLFLLGGHHPRRGLGGAALGILGGARRLRLGLFGGRRRRWGRLGGGLRLAGAAPGLPGGALGFLGGAALGLGRRLGGRLGLGDLALLLVALGFLEGAHARRPLGGGEGPAGDLVLELGRRDEILGLVLGAAGDLRHAAAG